MTTPEEPKRQLSYEELLAENGLLRQQVAELEERLKVLEDRLAQDSHNSGKPPSSDDFGRRTKSQRTKSGRASGGQKGHNGKTLKMVSDPDEVVLHRIEECSGCGAEVSELVLIDLDKRQVFDLPPLTLLVSEHQAEVRRCLACGSLNRSTFPAGVDHKLQYGPRLKGLAQYLQHYQLLPLKRLQQFFADLFGHNLSQGTLVNASAACYRELTNVEADIKRGIIGAKVIHVDETGLYEQGKRSWLHVTSTPKLTFYAAHRRRGKEALEAIGILPGYQGTAVHDAWPAYASYSCRHSLCNAHLLRELCYLQERHQQSWAATLADVLREMKAVRAEVEGQLSQAMLTEFEKRYDVLVNEGYEANPPLAEPTIKKRGRRKQSKARNLLDRLRQRRHEVLAFLYDLKVPFDNNLAERDIRMMKVQQKVSGCFRGQGATYFCRIRGYISTLRKQELNVLEGLESVFRGNPLMPQLGAE
jgi:transposase